MPRPQSPEPQLPLPDPARMRWDDLPASLRTRLGEHLAVLLRQAAARASAAPMGGGDDE